MVVKIRTGKRIQGALKYNERKVDEGKAELIMASRFACNIEDLDFKEKLTRFQRLNQLNEKVETNTLHLSLNFSPYDDLSNDKMQTIAWEYMERIGFGNQPFIVYRHHDSSHPHLHIVTTLIRPNGRRIKTHNLGRIQSETARKALEKEFDLIPAESMKKVVQLPFIPINVEKAIYGEHETKSSISNIVRAVTSSYHFTNLDELNAILKQYNVIADSGFPGSRMYANRGLVYSLLDKSGYKKGIPIKASSIYSSPTLNTLEKKFEYEKYRKSLYRSYSDKIMQEFLMLPKQLNEAQTKLWFSRRKISLEFIKNDLGIIEDILVVDNIKKAVFKINELNIHAAQVMSKIDLTEIKQSAVNSKSNTVEKSIIPDFSGLTSTTLKLIEASTKEEYDPTNQIPEHIRKLKKRNKKKK